LVKNIAIHTTKYWMLKEQEILYKRLDESNAQLGTLSWVLGTPKR
jgi:hypothetical protein